MTGKGFGLKAVAIGGLTWMLMAAMPAAHADDKVIVFAAASLKDALDAVNKACEPEVGEAATISYAASSALAKQIEGGAPADIFVSADLDWMKYLSDKKLTKPDTEVKLLGNQIVLVAPKDSTIETKVEKGFDLAKLIGDGKLAMGDFKAVPAGKYGKAALGIVYATDAHAEKGVKVVGTFPEDSHPPIIYPIAQTADSKDKDTAAFLKCVESAKAAELFKEQGFTVLAPSN